MTSFPDVMSLLVNMTPIRLKFRFVTKDDGIVNLNGLDSRIGWTYGLMGIGSENSLIIFPPGILTLAYATSRNEWKLSVFVVTSIDANWGTPVLNYWPAFQILYPSKVREKKETRIPERGRVGNRRKWRGPKYQPSKMK